MTKHLSIEEVLCSLTKIRKHPVNKYPEEIWTAISNLTNKYPLEKISKKLKMNLRYLQKKMNKIKGSNNTSITFTEVPTKSILSENIMIELTSGDLKAKIQGPVSCLNCIYELFGSKLA